MGPFKSLRPLLASLVLLTDLFFHICVIAYGSDMNRRRAWIEAHDRSASAASDKLDAIEENILITDPGVLVKMDVRYLKEALRHMITNVKSLREQLAPLLQRVREGEGINLQSGVSYLKAKYHLLLSYCVALIFYLLCKIEGVAMKGHEVFAKLVRSSTISY